MRKLLILACISCVLPISVRAQDSYLAEGQDRGQEVELETEWTVQEVSTVICAFARDRGENGECGDWCAPDRSRLSEYFEDRSEWVPTDEYCDELASSMVYWNSVYPSVPLEDLLTVGLREARFQPYAFGSAGECGVFQQHVQYARPESMRQDMGCYDNEHGTQICSMEARSNICEWFHEDIDNQVFSFVLKAVDYEARWGAEWPCHYREGYTCGYDGRRYLSDHNHRRRTSIEPALRRAHEMLSAEAETDDPL